MRGDYSSLRAASPRSSMKKRRWLTPDEVAEIRASPRPTRGKRGSGQSPYSIRSLAAKFGVSPAAVCSARAGKTWSDDDLARRRALALRPPRVKRQGKPKLRGRLPEQQPDVEVRQIPGWEGRYSVTADGRVWSHTYPARWLKLPLCYGYLRADLCRENVRFNMAVHRAVALAWIPKPDGREYVNHKNGAKTDNRVENLEWVTRSENEKHAWATGLRRSTPRHKDACRRNAGVASAKVRKLTADQDGDVARAYAAGGKRLIDLAAEYGVSITPIRRAIRLHVVEAAAPESQTNT